MPDTRYLIVENGFITNAVVGCPEGVECHERAGAWSEAWIGWAVVDGLPVKPPVPEPEPDPLQELRDQLAALLEDQNADPVAQPPNMLETRT